MNSKSLLAAKPDILLVEDNPENLRLLYMMLSDSGYKVRTAINGELALKAVEVTKPDLILLDINLPDINGYEICDKLKNKEQNADIPVIFISALDAALDKVKAFEVGARDYISKPFHFQEVLARIKNQLTILEQQKKLARQQNKLSEQSAQFQFLLTTVKAINEASDFHAALEVTLQQVCKKIGWDFGEFWILNSDATGFEYGKGWYASDQRFEQFRRKSETFISGIDTSLLRNICLSKQPLWLKDVSADQCEAFRCSQLAKEVELRACLGVPILFNDQVLAVLVFFKTEAKEPEERLIELVNAVATQLSSLIGHKHTEAALLREKTHLAQAQKVAHVGSWEFDLATKEMTWSDEIFRIYGLHPEQPTPTLSEHREKIHPEDRTVWDRAIKQLIKRKPCELEFRILRPDGSVRHLLGQGKPIFNSDGQVQTLFGTVLDITERKRVEDQLRQSQLFMQRVADTSPQILYIYDLRTGGNVYANHQIYEILGYTPEEVEQAGSQWFIDTWHPDDLSVLSDYSSRFANIPDGEVVETEFRQRHKNGSWRWLRSRAVVFTRNPDGSAKEIVGTITDISDRVSAEERLRLLQRAIAASSNGIVITDAKQPDNPVIYVNPGFERITGYSASEIIGNNCRFLQGHQTNQPALDELRSAIEEQRDCHVILQNYRKDGTLFWNEFSISPVRDGWGNLTHFIGIQADITKFKQAEAELQHTQKFLNSLLDNLPVGVFAKDAHELRFVFWNKACTQLMDYSASEVIGKSDYDLFPAEQADFCTDQDREALSSGKLVDSPAELVHTHHGTRLFNLKKLPILDDLGNPQYVLAIVEDITERRQAEEALKESEEKFRQMAESIRECFWMSDAQMSRVLYASPAYEQIWGRTCQSVYDRIDTWLEGVHPEDRQRVTDSLERLLRGEIVEQEYRVIRPDGSTVWVLDRTFPVYNSQGELYRLAGIIVDISDRKQAEEALKESEERFRQLAEHIHQVFWMISAESRQTLYVSPAYEQIWQRSSQSLYEDSYCWFDAIHPEDRERVLAARRQIPSESYSEEYRILRPDDSIRWIGSRAFPIRNERGEVYRIAGISEDITERKQAEAALKESEARFRAAAEGSLDAFFIFQSVRDETGRIVEFSFVDINSKGEQLISRHREDVIGKRLCELLPINHREGFFEKYVRVVETGEVLEEEFAVAMPNFKAAWLHHQVVPLADGIAITTRDITERKRAAQELAVSEQKFRAVFDSTLDGILIADDQGCVVDANPAACALLALSQEQLKGCPITGFAEPVGAGSQTSPLHSQNTGKPAPIQNTQNDWQKLLAQRQMRGEFRFHLTDGATKEVEYSAKANFLPGLHLWAFHDITERKHAEEALRTLTQQEQERAVQLEQALKQLQRTQTQLVHHEKMASLGQLVAGVAHEINNPTSFIYGNIHPASEYAKDLLHLLQLYQRNYPEPVAEIAEQLEYIDLDFITEDFPKLLASMKEGADRISQIVLSLRNFSRLDQRERKLVDIHQGIDSTLLILKHRLKQHAGGSEIQLIKEYGELPLVVCYPGPLNQVFMNIISNAIDALEDAHGSWFMVHGNQQDAPNVANALLSTMNNQQSSLIQIRTKVVKQKWVVIRIADNGPGLTPELQQRIFDPFFTTKPPGKGTGLGLSISYQIVVDKHGGRLRCHSTPGQGAEFIIELPINPSQIPEKPA